jgi:hypothetical protein
LIDADMVSPGLTVMVLFGIAVSAAGRISHQAWYSAAPLTQSCSVPVWIRLLLLKPSMPSQLDEKLFVLVGLTVGTCQLPVTLAYGPPVTAYPDQLLDAHPNEEPPPLFGGFAATRGLWTIATAGNGLAALANVPATRATAMIPNLARTIPPSVPPIRTDYYAE